MLSPYSLFAEPKSPNQRKYEAFRACFFEKTPVPVVAKRFGYTPGSLHVMCSKFRKSPSLDFIFPPKGKLVSRGNPNSPRCILREKIISLRKENLSIYDIALTLKLQQGKSLTPTMIGRIFRQEGFAKLPRRADEERPNPNKTTIAKTSDVNALDLSHQNIHTRFGGIFLFLPFLARIPLEQIFRKAQLPGSEMVPPLQAILSLLSLKLFGNRRLYHGMSYVLDPGLALFSGINVLPKRGFLTQYSSRISPEHYPSLMKLWFDAVNKIGLPRGTTFDLDFHTIPFHGENAILEKHYVFKRSRRQKGILAFLARDAEQNVLCFSNAAIRKADQNGEVIRFMDFWRQRTGQYPKELVFDRRLTTYAYLSQLNAMGIQFITLRRRSKKMLNEVHLISPSTWKKIKLPNIARQYRTPRIIDQRIELKDYSGELRQLTIKDLGHEEPTFLKPNQLKLSSATLITRYAQRMVIENNIADCIDFFHMDVLSSAVAMKTNCDLQLTLMANSLYRLLGHRIGDGYEKARARTIFRDFIDATANISIEEKDIFVHFQKRSHNPLLLGAGYTEEKIPIPWLDNWKLNFCFG